MMAKHDVFKGWVDLRDPDLVPEKLRRPVVEYSANGGKFIGDEVTSEAVEYFNHFNDLLAVALVEAWSFDEPITVEGLLNLPKKAYDDIRAVVSPFLNELMPNFEVDIDPKVTTDS